VVTSSFDPYDIWSSQLGVSTRREYYAGSKQGKLKAVSLALIDWLFPDFGRYLVSAEPRMYPISLGHEVIRCQLEHHMSDSEAEECLGCAQSIGIKDNNDLTYSWGLGFPWMSKNGLYGPDIPFVTHTPYVMEALLALAKVPSVHDEAMGMFFGTWGFLESLKVMFENEEALALSYAPIDEPRMVVNANAYAAFAYALHAVHGKEEIRETAKSKVEQITRWVTEQQKENGSWAYYADEDSGNFIDCFHSCFVVKNLLKTRRLIPESADIVDQAIDRGWSFIRNELYDKKSGLCRRFAVRAQRDPFRWDLYDQAEYLGLLVDFGLLDEAQGFAARVEKRFRKGEHWYCRIDVFGRRWGKDFLRWGIVPFWYHQTRLKQTISGR